MRMGSWKNTGTYKTQAESPEDNGEKVLSGRLTLHTIRLENKKHKCISGARSFSRSLPPNARQVDLEDGNGILQRCRDKGLCCGSARVAA